MKKIPNIVADSFLFLGFLFNSLSDKIVRYGIGLHVKFRTEKGIQVAKQLKSSELAMAHAAKKSKVDNLKQHERQEEQRLKNMIKNNTSKGDI